jgi:hypothetical protein
MYDAILSQVEAEVLILSGCAVDILMGPLLLSHIERFRWRLTGVVATLQ